MSQFPSTIDSTRGKHGPIRPKFYHGLLPFNNGAVSKTGGVNHDNNNNALPQPWVVINRDAGSVWARLDISGCVWSGIFITGTPQARQGTAPF